MTQANCVLESCHSTNDILKELAENGYPHGTWISTRRQESGRGRLGRKWESIEGNLFLSILVRIENRAHWSWVPLATAVGMVRHLRTQFLDLDIRVKWPNDIWLREAKLGGILCETSSKGGASGNSTIVIGIGLNCIRAPEGLDQEVIDLTSAQGGRPVTADHVRSSLIVSVLNEVDQLVLEGPEKLRAFYREFAAYPAGTPVKWGQEQTGFIHDLGPLGELIVKRLDGTMSNLFAEDVKLKAV